MSGSLARLPAVAVVVPAFDAEEFLAEALASIFAQRPVPSQVLVVDDGSTDRTAEIAGATPGVELLRQPNRGPAAARNAGLAAAATELVGLLDADDAYAPGAIERLASALSADEALDGVFGRVAVFEHGSGEPPEPQPGTAYLAGAGLYRRSAFGRFGHFDESLRLGEFIDWCDRARTGGGMFGALDDVVLHRRLRPGSLSSAAGGARSDYLRIVRSAMLRRRTGGAG